MADYIIDLSKRGKNFAVLANTRSEESIKGLPNPNLPKGFRDQLNAVHNFIFGVDLPMEGDDFTFLLKYRDGRFDKIYYPNLVKGCADNENASDPNAIYIRWGKSYKKLFMWETKKKNSYTIHMGTQEGNEESEFDYSISAYGFNGDKYADPALVLNFIDDEGDSYTHYFPIKVVPLDEEEGKIDYVAKINTAMKRGIDSFLSVLSEAKEFKPSLPVVSPRELDKCRVYGITGFTILTSKKGKEIIKLSTTENFDIWCDYSLISYIKSGSAVMSEDNPVALVVADEYTVVAKNGNEYTNLKIALSQVADGFINFNPPGTVLDKSDAIDFYEKAQAEYLGQYKYPVTYNDRDLDENVEYQLIGYSSRPTRAGGYSHKLIVIDPRDNNRMELWCPDNLIPTILQKPDVTPEKPSIFKVVKKDVKEDKVFADSIIVLSTGAMIETIDLNF